MAVASDELRAEVGPMVATDGAAFATSDALIDATGRSTQRARRISRSRPNRRRLEPASWSRVAVSWPLFPRE